ncbi:MAG: tetratricopeptide repeat protein [Pseudomonadota bacterium]
MMRGPARLLALLAVTAVTQVAAASDRFVPADPDFVVANVRQAMPDEELRGLLTAWRSNPEAETGTVALAAAFIDRARSLREPRYFGRAEAVLAPRANQAGAGTALRRLYAQVLQYRHAFAAAEALVDSILRDAPHDADARLLRASIRLVRGDFAGARGDCAQLAAAGGNGAQIGFVCLAEALAGGGQFARAQALLANAPTGRANEDPHWRAYLLATRAELRERTLDFGGAIADYGAALALAPQDDSVRAALADALAARGEVRDAQELLTVDKPSLSLLVRSAALSRGARRAEFSARAAAWLDLEAARGDSIHYREAAMLALTNGQPGLALDAAAKNFDVQRELPDVRVLARAATAARDEAALQALRAWLRKTGYRDSVTENLLGAAARS